MQSGRHLNCNPGNAWKAAAFAGKKSTEKSRKEFGRRLDFNYLFFCNKVMWLHSVLAKDPVVYVQKDPSGSILSEENEILLRWEYYNISKILEPSNT